MNKNMRMAVNALEQNYQNQISGFYSNLGLGTNRKYNKLWQEAGYQELITASDLFAKYQRNGYARGAISAIMNCVWENDPFMVEGDKDKSKHKDETATEKEIKRFARKRNLWSLFRQADIARSVCEYSAMIIRVKDNKGMHEPLDSISSWSDIVEVTIVWQQELTVADRNNDYSSTDYQKPTMYNYIEYQVDGVVNQNSHTSNSTQVHASRVFLLGDIYGIGQDAQGNKILVPGFNALTALEQINAAGTAGSVKAAAQHMTWEFENSSAISDIAKQYGVKVDQLQDAFQKMVDRVNSNLDSAIIASGAKISTLDVNMPDLDEARKGPMEEFASSVGVPITELVGFQTGERSSSENASSFRKNCKARQESVETGDIERFFEWLQGYGLFDSMDLQCEWENLLEPTQNDKMDIAVKMADVNQKMSGTGEMVFTTEEMRVVGGQEPIAEKSEEQKRIEKDGESMMDIEDEQTTTITK